MRDEELRRALRARAEADLTHRFPPRAKTSFAVFSLAIVAALALALALTGGNFIAGSNNIIQTGGSIEVHHKAEMRRWQDLSMAERHAIKREAIQQFPQIRNIGQGVSWQPVSEWLTREKGIVHSNVRSLFRGDLSKYDPQP